MRRNHAHRLESRAPAPWAKYVDDPTGFAINVLGWEPWEKQREIGEALVESQRVSVVSCNGAGKTCWAARLAIWFTQTRRDSIVITTAPTWHQVGLLFRELRAAFGATKRPLIGEVMSTRLDIEPNWYATGLSTDKEERFQGLHAKGGVRGGDGGLLVIVDEASGVGDHIFDAMRGFLTSDNTYSLLIGNPNHSTGEFYESHQRGQWTRMHIAAQDVPEHILSRSWIAEQEAYWGPESDQFKVRVLGEFPSGGGDYQLIPRPLLESAADAVPGPQHIGNHMGLDIARSGHDRNVAVITRDGRVIHTDSWEAPNLMDTARRARDLATSYRVPANCIHVDTDGIGAGVVDKLRELGLGIDPVDFGSKPKHDWHWLLGKEVKLLNRRAELHWAARHALLGGHAAIPKRYENSIWRQLAWSNYEYNQKGILKIEPKDAIRARHGASPDYADAWVLSLSRTASQRRILII